MDRLALRPWGRTLALRTLPRSLTLIGGTPSVVVIEALLERLAWAESATDTARVSASEALGEAVFLAEASQDAWSSASAALDAIAFGESAVALSSMQEPWADSLGLGEAVQDSLARNHATSDSVSEALGVSEARTSTLSASCPGTEALSPSESGASLLATALAISDVLVAAEAWTDAWSTRAAMVEPIPFDDASYDFGNVTDARAEPVLLAEGHLDLLATAGGAPLVESEIDSLATRLAVSEAFALIETRSDSFSHLGGTQDALTEAIAAVESISVKAGLVESRSELVPLSSTDVIVEARTELLAPVEAVASAWAAAPSARTEVVALSETENDDFGQAAHHTTDALTEAAPVTESGLCTIALANARQEPIALVEAKIEGGSESRPEAISVTEARSDAISDARPEALTFAESRTDSLSTATANAWTEALSESIALSTKMDADTTTEDISVTEDGTDSFLKLPFVAARGTINTTTTQTVNVNVPASQAGDILLAIIEERINGDTGSHACTGFAQIGTTQRVGYARISTWWLRSAGTDGTSAVSMSKSGANLGTMCVVALRSVDTSSTPLDSGSDATLRSCATSGTTVTVPGITVAVAGSLCLAIVGHGHATNTAETFAYSSGGICTVNTTVGAVSAGSSTTRIAGTVYWGVAGATGAMGNQVLTSSSSTAITSTYPCAGKIIAFKAATS